jgi:hypothetical protein
VLAGARAGAVRPVGFLRHGGFRWLWIAAILALVAGAGYRYADVHPRPGGGTWYGYVLGIAGAVLILWLAFLGVRKRAITPGRWVLKGWVSAHVYLGLAVVVIVTLHTGFEFGWNVHTLAYVLMLAVVASGIFGATAYATLPAALSENRGELTQVQMLEHLRQFDSRLDQAAEGLDETVARIVEISLEHTRVAGVFIERLTGLRFDCGNRRAIAALARLRRQRARSPGPELEQIAALLDLKEKGLGQLRRHIRMRSLLGAWLYVHVPATFALLAALTAHIVSVFFYW